MAQLTAPHGHSHGRAVSVFCDTLTTATVSTLTTPGSTCATQHASLPLWPACEPPAPFLPSTHCQLRLRRRQRTRTMRVGLFASLCDLTLSSIRRTQQHRSSKTTSTSDRLGTRRGAAMTSPRRPAIMAAGRGVDDIGPPRRSRAGDRCPTKKPDLTTYHRHRRLPRRQQRPWVMTVGLFASLWDLTLSSTRRTQQHRPSKTTSTPAMLRTRKVAAMTSPRPQAESAAAHGVDDIGRPRRSRAGSTGPREKPTLGTT